MSIDRAGRWAGVAAALLWTAAVLGFGAALPGFEQARHPLTLLGASGVPKAMAFNLLAFLLPALLAGWVALILLRRVAAEPRWSLRIGAQLVLLSVLAFAGMGLLPLDSSDLENRASQLHASAWMLWVVAFVPGSLLLAIGGRGDWRGLARLSLLCGLGVAGGAFVLAALVPVALAQRLAFAAWLLWLAAAPWALSARGADRRPG